MLKDLLLLSPAPARAASWFSLPLYTSSADLGKTLGPQTPGFLCLCRSLSTFATGTNPILKRCGFTVGTGFLATCRCRRFPAQGHHGQLFLRGLKVPEEDDLAALHEGKECNAQQSQQQTPAEDNSRHPVVPCTR